MSSVTYRKTFSGLASGFLILCLILTPTSLTRMNHADAYGDASLGMQVLQLAKEAGTYVQTAFSAVSNAATAGGISTLVTKEMILDKIAWPLANIVLKEMIRSTTRWVKSGFKGSPAFVTDLQGFLLDIADKVAGNYIYGTPLSALCSPFSLNIKLALDIQYKETSRGGYVAQCRLSSVIANVDRFMQGDFMQGGWDGWYSVALTPANNPYGAMLEAQGGLYASIAGKQLIERDKLSFGKGFFSTEYCRSEGDDERCSVETPGVIVQDQVNRALGLPGDRLVVADEINELVGALFSQLASQALSGVGGLLGLSTSYNGAPSYLDRVAAEQTQTTSLSGTDPMATAIIDESKYIGFQTLIINLITDANTYKDRVYGSSTCSTGDLTTSLTSQLNLSKKQVATSSLIIDRLTIYQSDYRLLEANTTNASIIDGILIKYDALSIPDAQSKIIGQYLQYQSSGALHTQGDLINLELTTIPNVKDEIASFTASIDQGCQRRGNNNDKDSGD